MGNDVSDLILTSIYNDWGLDEADRRMIDDMGIDGAEGLCAIHVALGQMFAHNPQLASLWPTTPNKTLQNLSPLELIRRDGIKGIRRIRGLLEAAW